MAMTFEGGCACGSIRYECSADAPESINCHCRDCQRASGTAYASALVVPAASLKLTKGQPKFYSVTADSGHISCRGFCADCGSPVLAKVVELPTLMVIQAASLDDPTRHRPTVDLFASSAQPWDFMDPALPKFEKEPSR
jgi:hypothetical protein